MNPYLEDVKIDNRTAIPSTKLNLFHTFNPKEFEFNEYYYTSRTYQDLAEKIAKEENKIVDKVIYNAFRDYLECRSGEDIYNILTSNNFYKYNEIVDIINNQLNIVMKNRYFCRPFGKLSIPIKESEELKHQFIRLWEDIYGKDD